MIDFVMFEKDISKVLSQFIDVFEYHVELEYDSWRFSNHKILILKGRDGFKLDSYKNVHVIANCIKTFKKLGYFRKIIFKNIFYDYAVWAQDKYDALDVWGYRLKEKEKIRGIVRSELDLNVFTYI